jgi:hypothetical protein
VQVIQDMEFHRATLHQQTEHHRPIYLHVMLFRCLELGIFEDEAKGKT